MYAFKPAEEKVILGYVYALNVNGGTPATYQDLMLRFPTLFRRKGAEAGLKALKGVVRLPDNSYVRRNRKALGKIWGAIDYEKRFAMQGQGRQVLQEKQDFINRTLDEIDHSPLQGDELLEAAGSHFEVQSIILSLVGEAKTRIMSEHDFSMTMIVTDSQIYKNATIKENIPDARSRSEAIDMVLRFIYSSGMVWMGRFSNPELGGDLDYFYFDIGLFSEGSFSLLNRLKSSPDYREGNKAMQQIVGQLEDFYQDKLKSYFLEKYTSFVSKLENLKRRIRTPGISGPEEEKLILHFNEVWHNISIVDMSFTRENRTFFFGKEIFDLKNQCEHLGNELKEMSDRIPAEIYNFMRDAVKTGSLVDIMDETNEFFAIIDSSLRNRDNRIRKKSLIDKIIVFYEDVFKEFLDKNLMRIQQVPAARGGDDTTITMGEFYIHYNRETGSMFIYDRYNSVEIDMKAKIQTSSVFRKNKENFLYMQKCLVSYLRTTKVLVQLRNMIVHGE